MHAQEAGSNNTKLASIFSKVSNKHPPWNSIKGLFFIQNWIKETVWLSEIFEPPLLEFYA